MFSAILLVCNIEATVCETISNSYIFNTIDQCYESIEIGIVAYEQLGYVVVDYDCYLWDTPIFDEAL